MSQPIPPVAMSANPRWVLGLTALVSFMVALDALVVTTALAAIRHDFNASMEAAEWTVNAYNLTFAVLLMAGAAIGDRYGRRKMLIAGLVLFTLASAACGFSGNVVSLIAFRALQGVGAALMMPLAMALLGVAFPKETRAKALGIFSSVTGLALIVGPAIGGGIAEGLAWQWIFWINIPIGLALISLLAKYIPESQASGTTLDIAGMVLAICAAAGAAWGLVRGHVSGWGSIEIMIAAAIFLLSIVLFIAWEKRAAAPMIPPRLFHSRTMSATLTASFLFYAPMYGTLFFLPQFFQAQGAEPLQAGLRLLPWTATLFVVAPFAGSLVSRIGERALVIVGVVAQAAGMGLLAVIASYNGSYLQMVAPLILAGAGVSMAMPAAQNAVMSAVAPPDIGKATGTFNVFRYLGGFFGVALLVEVFGRTGGVATAQSFATGFSYAMATACGLSLASAFAALGLPGRRAPSAHAAATPASSISNADGAIQQLSQ